MTEPRAKHTNLVRTWELLEGLMPRWKPTIFHDGWLWVVELRNSDREAVGQGATVTPAILIAVAKALNYDQEVT